MSLQTDYLRLATRPERGNGFAATVRAIFRQMRNDHDKRRADVMRRQAKDEIDKLPESLRRDLGPSEI